MQTVTSRDGTTLAFTQSGAGPALVLVGGALEQRSLNTETAQLAAVPLLSEHFSVFHYDRRGRGQSTDTLPYAVAREIEDIEAIIHAAGGSAFVFGISSGAALALEATLALPTKIKRLAMYEPPYNSSDAARSAWRQYRAQLNTLLSEGRGADAVKLLMLYVGMPPEHLPGIHNHPMWPMFEAVAQTLAYDAAVLGEDASVPLERAANLAVPTLIMDGEKSYPFMHVTATALAQVIPQAQHRQLEGQTHTVDVMVLAPVLTEFFRAAL